MEAGSGQRIVKLSPRLQHRVTPVRAGLICLLIVVIATFLAFSKRHEPDALKAMFDAVAE